MEQKNQRNSRKRLNSLILLVAFTAVMLIVSTYAWFSAQRDVTLGGLKGKVSVAEGLQISLDALNWRNEIDLSEQGIIKYFEQTNTDAGLTAPDEIYSLKQPYALTLSPEGKPQTYSYNTVPDELVPASTTGSASIGQADMKLYRGENTEGITLNTIHDASEDGEKGYFAIDFFLQNTSSPETIAKGTPDLLRLEKNTELTLDAVEKNTTGLQNAVRVAFVLFDNGNGEKIKVENTPTQREIIQETQGKTIKDVSIWEPNASGAKEGSVYNQPAHVDFVTQTNNKITFSSDDATKYSIVNNRFKSEQLIPTYALTEASLNSKYTVTTENDTSGIKDIYNWDTVTTTGLTKQNTVATTVSGVQQVTQLKSAKDGTTDFGIAAGQYHKLRMYVWLEGQDVDCINYASLGGGINLNVGLSK